MTLPFHYPFPPHLIMHGGVDSTRMQTRLGPEGPFMSLLQLPVIEPIPSIGGRRRACLGLLMRRGDEYLVHCETGADAIFKTTEGAPFEVITQPSV